jgi:hypothetical protein
LQATLANDVRRAKQRKRKGERKRPGHMHSATPFAKTVAAQGSLYSRHDRHRPAWRWSRGPKCRIAGARARGGSLLSSNARRSAERASMKGRRLCAPLLEPRGSFEMCNPGLLSVFKVPDPNWIWRRHSLMQTG